MFQTLQKAFPQIAFQRHVSLAPHTTVKIGGPAEFFTEITDQKLFTSLCQYCRKEQIPLTILGWGANTLIADRGIRGLVIKNKTQAWEIIESTMELLSLQTASADPRWESDNSKNNLTYSFEDLDYNESETEAVYIKVDSGMPLSLFITQLIQQEVTGLQWFSRIPATIGGAIVNNVHGGTHFLSEYLVQVEVVTPSGELIQVNATDLDFGYDFSRFHYTDEIITSSIFRLHKGDIEKAKLVVVEWAKRKKLQPQNSLGCIFQNITSQEQLSHTLPTPSVGYIVDQILHKKGFNIGDAKISEHHAAFIENIGNATAQDYLDLIQLIIVETKDALGIQLKPEIFFLGFTEQELEGIY